MRPNRFRSRPPAACTPEADGRLCRNARLPDMCERPRRMQRPPLAWPALGPSSQCQTARCAAWFRAARLFPATHLCARVGLYPFAPDPKRGGRSADRRTISVVAFARRDWSARVRRGASHDAGRSPLGAPPWRFSAGGRASISGIASGSVQRAPRSQVVMPGGRCPGPPEPAVTSRGRRTPLPAPPFRTVSGRRPSMSEDANRILQTRYVVKRYLRIVAKRHGHGHVPPARASWPNSRR